MPAQMGKKCGRIENSSHLRPKDLPEERLEFWNHPDISSNNQPGSVLISIQSFIRKIAEFICLCFFLMGLLMNCQHPEVARTLNCFIRNSALQSDSP